MRLATLAFVLCAATAQAQTAYQGMTIPAGKPLLLIDEDELTTLRSRYSASPSTYDYDADFPGNPTAAQCAANPFTTACGPKSADIAFRALITNDGTCDAGDGGGMTTCREAIDWLLACASSSVSCFWNASGVDPDAARYYMEDAVITENWLFYQFPGTAAFTDAERTTIYTAINRGVARYLQESFGSGRFSGSGAGGTGGDTADVSSNYNWGFTRFAFLWGISSFNESFTMAATSCTFSSAHFSIDMCSDSQNTIARAFLDEWDTRWDNLTSYINHVNVRGGVHLNGTTSYGKYFVRYMTAQFYTTEKYGRDTWAEAADWFIDHAWWALYSMHPKNVAHTNTSSTLCQMYSFGATQETGTTPCRSEEEGTFFTYAAKKLNGTTIEAHLRDYITRVDPDILPWYRLLDDEIGTSGSRITTQPLDIYARGFGHFVGRSSHSSGAGDNPATFTAQLRTAEGHHLSCTAGTWQLVYDTEWASKETAVYSQSNYLIPDWGGSAYDGGLTIAGRNSVTINSSNWDAADGCYAVQPTILRTSRGSWGWHGAVDLLTASGVTGTCLIREFVWVRDYNYVVTLDRACTASSATARQVAIHCPTNPPAVSSDTFTCSTGTVRMKHQFLAGSVASQTIAGYTEYNESTADAGDCPSITCDPQFRVQMSFSGLTTGYAPTFSHAYEDGDNIASASLSEDGSNFTITITKTGVDNVVIIFPKGSTSASGGSIQIGSAAAVNFGATVTIPTISASGVDWAGESALTGGGTRVRGIRLR